MFDPTDPSAFDAYGDYLDGTRPVLNRVGLKLMADRLRLYLPEGDHLDWSLEDLRALPDQADPAEMVLHLDGDPVARLILRETGLRQRIELAAHNLHRAAPIKGKGKILGWAAGAIASVALIIFVLVPVMANQLAVLLPPEGEKALGDATFERIRSALSDEDFTPLDICEGPEGVAALATMEARLDAGRDLPYPVTVTVLDHELVNAFALPGGRIVFFRGLLEEAGSAEEVAAIFAHEIGHVVGRDPTRDALRLAGSMGVLGLLFGDFAGGTVVLLLANQLINMKYSQAAETGADDYAHKLLTDAGLPPAALGTFFERLREEHGDAEGLAAHFSTHPQMTARIEAALAAQGNADAAAALGEPVLTDAQWRALRDICGTTSPTGNKAGEIKVAPDPDSTESDAPERPRGDDSLQGSSRTGRD